MNRKTLILSTAVAAAAAFLFVRSSAAKDQSSLRTVPSVDLKRYTGKWYEISRYPNRFQKECTGDSTAEYSLRDDGKINVVNSCRKANGEMKQSKGTAKVADKQTNSKLKVTFFWPFYGDYWIVDLGDQYDYAVVSEPQRKYLWILSRTPTLDPDKYRSILERLRAMGFDTSKLIVTPQSAA